MGSESIPALRGLHLPFNVGGRPLLSVDDSAALVDINKAMSANTRRAYESDLSGYLEYCTTRRLGPGDVDTVAGYVRHQASEGRKLSTIQRSLAAIAKAHEIHCVLTGDDELADPTKHIRVSNAVKAYRKQVSADVVQVAPLTSDRLLAVLHQIDTSTPAGARDMALLLVGWFGAFRRSELAGMRIEHIEFDADGHGVTIVLPRSKSAQDRTVTVGIAASPASRFDPVHMLADWCDYLANVPGGHASNTLWPRTTRGGSLMPSGRTSRTGAVVPLLVPLSAGGVNGIVQRRVRASGLDNPDSYSAHSLRHGFVTEARHRKIDPADIMAHTRHSSIEMMSRYDHPAGIWTRNPTAEITL